MTKTNCNNFPANHPDILYQPKIYNTIETIYFESLPKKVVDREICHEPVKVYYGNGYGLLFLEEHTHSDILRWLASDMGLSYLQREVAKMMEDEKPATPNQEHEPEHKEHPKIYRTVEKIDFESLPQKVMDGEICHEPVLVDHWHGIGSMFTEEHSHCDILRWLAKGMGGLENLIEIAELMRHAKLGGYEPVPAPAIVPPDLIRDAIASATADLPRIRQVLNRWRDHAIELEGLTDEELDYWWAEIDGGPDCFAWRPYARAVIAADRARAALAKPEPKQPMSADDIVKILLAHSSVEPTMGTDRIIYQSEIMPAANEIYERMAELAKPGLEVGEGPPAVTSSALLHPAYEPDDGSADGAQMVGMAWWRPVMGCDSLQLVVDNARNILRSRWARPAIEPVPAAERLPTEADCDAEGRCWLTSVDVEPGWVADNPEQCTNWTHWLPHYALPVPTSQDAK